jgi:hypothetical protein
MNNIPSSNIGRSLIDIRGQDWIEQPDLRMCDAAWFRTANAHSVMQAFSLAPLQERQAIACFFARECSDSPFWGVLCERMAEQQEVADAQRIAPFIDPRPERPDDLLQDNAAPLAQALVRALGGILPQQDDQGPQREACLRLLRSHAWPAAARQSVHENVYGLCRTMKHTGQISDVTEAAMIDLLDVPNAFKESYEISRMSALHLSHGGLTVSQGDSFSLKGLGSPTHSQGPQRTGFDVSSLSICTELNSFISPCQSPVSQVPAEQQQGVDDSSDSFQILLRPMYKPTP